MIFGSKSVTLRPLAYQIKVDLESWNELLKLITHAHVLLQRERQPTGADGHQVETQLQLGL